MPVHTLRRTTILDTTIAQAWGFFSDPRNLSKITPPEMGFTVVSDPPERVYAGLMIEYRVRPLRYFPVTWLTGITDVVEGRLFVDEQRVGPYRLWHHEHHFSPRPEGGVEMTDLVTYVLPFGWLGNLVHPFLVAPQLRRIFDYRQGVIDRLFRTPAPGL